MALRARASKDRTMERALSRTGMLVFAVIALHCSSTPPVGSTGVAIVAGIGETCASELTEVDVQATTGMRIDLSQTFPVSGVEDLPVLSSLTYPGDPGSIHTATAIFNLQ